MSGFDQKWETIHSTREWGRYPDNHLVRFIMRNKGLLGKDVLDIGCGIGAQSEFMQAEGFNVIGIDASASAIQRAVDNQVAQEPVYEVRNVTELPFEDDEFDLVTDICCLQHIHDPYHITAVHEITHVLRPGGWLFSISAKWDHSHVRADTALRTMRRDDIQRIYAPPGGLRLSSVDQASFSDRNGADWISHWIIIARKP